MAEIMSETKTTNPEMVARPAPVKDEATAAAPATPVEAPATAKASQPTAAPAPAAEKAAKPAPAAKTAPKPARAAKKVAKPAPVNAAAAKAASVPAVKAAPLRQPRKAVPVTKKPAAKPVTSVTTAAMRRDTRTARPAFKTLNEGPRTMNIETSKITDRVQAAFGDVNARAKDAIERNSRVAEEMTDLTKGNVEALVASSKLVAKGVESLGQEVAEYGRKSFEDASAAFKTFAEVKTPTDFFRLQSEFARAQFDSFVAESSKLSETVLKLAGEAAEPITSRYSVAAEKVKAVTAI
jgi:phasin family protein